MVQVRQRQTHCVLWMDGKSLVWRAPSDVRWCPGLLISIYIRPRNFPVRLSVTREVDGKVRQCWSPWDGVCAFPVYDALRGSCSVAPAAAQRTENLTTLILGVEA